MLHNTFSTFCTYWSMIHPQTSWIFRISFTDVMYVGADSIHRTHHMCVCGRHFVYNHLQNTSIKPNGFFYFLPIPSLLRAPPFGSPSRALFCATFECWHIHNAPIRRHFETTEPILAHTHFLLIYLQQQLALARFDFQFIYTAIQISLNGH